MEGQGRRSGAGELLDVDLRDGETGAAGGLDDDLAGAAEGKRVLEAAVGFAAEDSRSALRVILREDLRRKRSGIQDELNVELLDAHACADDGVALAGLNRELLLEDLTLLEVAGERRTFGLHALDFASGELVQQGLNGGSSGNRNRRRRATTCRATARHAGVRRGRTCGSRSPGRRVAAGGRRVARRRRVLAELPLLICGVVRVLRRAAAATNKGERGCGDDEGEAHSRGSLRSCSKFAEKKAARLASVERSVCPNARAEDG